MSATAPAPGRWFLPALAGYFLLFALTRVLIADGLELDEAEQALLSQWWQWGYSAQPPLYTWLQGAVNHMLGANLVALALLREGLLFLACLFVYRSARRLLPDRLTAIASTLALALIPQFVWENQREHTHSLLVLTLAAATLWLVLRLLERPNLRDYLLAGLVVALGGLAKYNFALVAAALAAALITLPEGRRVLWDRRVWPALGLLVLVLAPHGLWLAHHPEVGGAVGGKLAGAAAGAGGPWPHRAGPGRALGLVALTTLTFLTPFWLVFAALFPTALVPTALRPSGGGGPRRPVAVRLIGRWLAFGLGALVLTAWVSGADELKERWLQPLLFCAPLWLFARLPPVPAPARRLRRFTAIATGAALVVFAVTVLRLPLAPLTGGYSRLHQPMAALGGALAPLAPPGALILADHYHLAGALRPWLPGRVLVGPREDFVLPPLARLAAGRPVVLVWDVARSADLPAALAAMASAAGRPPAGAAPTVRSAPYRHGAGREYRLGVLVLPTADGGR